MSTPITTPDGLSLLRELAERSKSAWGSGGWFDELSFRSIATDREDAEYLAAVNPIVVLGLLDRIAELEARVNHLTPDYPRFYTAAEIAALINERGI